MRRTLFWVAASAALAGCGDTTSGECGEGTYLEDGRCFPVDPNDATPPSVTVDPPRRTRVVGDVRLVSDEPAEIYYTTDGTIPTFLSAHEASNVLIPDVPDDGVVQYFAVDRAGNKTPVVRLAWDVDRVPPGPPRRFALGLTGTTRALSWANPAGVTDFAGTIVARVEGRAVAPEPGVAYAVGDEIAPGVTVVSVGPLDAGAAGSFAETRPTSPGLVRYVAWSYDDLRNYSPTASAHALVDIPAQTAAISIDAAAGTVSVPTPPAHVGVTGSAVLDGSTLTVTLAIENRTNRVLFAPKVLLEDIAGTSGAWDDEDGDIDAAPYRAYGAAISPGATVTRTFEFTGVGASDVVTATARIRSDHALAVAYWEDATAGAVLDAATGSQILELPSAGREAAGTTGRQSLRAGGITPDGMLVYGSRNASRLSVFDLGTATLVGGVTLSPYKSSTAQVVLGSGGGTAYALVMPAHAYSGRRGGVASTLVRVDMLTLAEAGRLEIGGARGRTDMRVSPDGRRLAIAGGVDAIVIVDLDTFTVAARIAEDATAIAWSPDGTRLAAASTLGLRTYDTSTWTLAARFDTLGGGKAHRIAFTPDGRLWVGRSETINTYDLTAGTSSERAAKGNILELFDGVVHVGGDSTIRRLDDVGADVLTWDLSDTAYGHTLVRSPF